MSLLDCLDTKGKSERGSWLHLKNPATKDPLYLDDDQTRPVRILMKGPDSDTFAEYFRAKQRQSVAEQSYQDQVKDESAFYADMALDWENMPPVQGDDETVPFSRKAALAHFTALKDLRDQAFAHITKREHFFTEPEMS